MKAIVRAGHRITPSAPRALARRSSRPADAGATQSTPQIPARRTLKKLYAVG
jgi:hypothetical protein